MKGRDFKENFNLQRLFGVAPVCRHEFGGWAAALSVGCDIAASVNRFCTVIGAKSPADATDDKLVDADGNDCGVACGASACDSPSNQQKFSLKLVQFICCVK
jgi:hypothetical protein